MATFFCEFDAQEILSPCPEKKIFIGREIKLVSIYFYLFSSMIIPLPRQR
jgi:hypothetical protein